LGETWRRERDEGSEAHLFVGHLYTFAVQDFHSSIGFALSESREGGQRARPCFGHVIVGCCGCLTAEFDMFDDG
jgi:hypothetical protein